MNQCPKCQTNLEMFALKCEHCGWSIIASQPPDAANGQGDRPISLSPSNLTGDESNKSLSPTTQLNNNHRAERASKSQGASPAANHSRVDSERLAQSVKAARREFERGMELVEAEDFANAMAHFNRAIVIAPVERLGEFYSLRGYCHLKQSDFRRAEKDCTEAIRLNCCDPQTYAWRAAARGEQLNWPAAFDDLDLACIAAGSQRDAYLELMESYADTASEHYRSEIAAGNDSAHLFFSRGWVYLRCGKYDKSFRDFQLAIKLERDHPWAWTGLAKLWTEEHIDAATFEKIDQNIEVAVPPPNDDSDIIRWCSRGEHGDVNCRREALQMRSRLYRDAGKLDAAKKDLQTLVDMAGDDPDALVACCELRFEMGQAMPAVTQLNQVLKAHPEFQKALLLRGRCFACVKNYSLAASDLTRYHQLNSEDHVAGIELAKVYLATNQIDNAEVQFEKAINANHGSFDAYHGFSRVFLKKNRLDVALTQCQKAIAIDNRRAEAFATEAEIYLRLSDDTRGIDSYCRAINIESNEEVKANYLYMRGVAYYNLNQFEAALEDFQKSCQLRPNHAGGLVWKAAACSRLEQWTQAIVCLNRAMEIRPNAAQQYQQLGRPVARKAIKHFNRRLLENEDDVDTYRERALANQFLSMFASSIDDLTTALDLEPGNADLLIRRGQVYAITGDQKSAIEDFSRAVKIDRRNHLARYYRAQARVKCGHTDRAQRDIQKAIRIDSLQPAYHHLLAKIYLQNNRPDQVVLSLDRSILLDSTDVAAFKLRGDVQAKLKNYFSAVSDYTRALELDPSLTELLVLRAQTLVKANKPREAIEDFEMALTRDPHLPKAYSGRALALASLGAHEYATIWLTKALHRFKKPRDLAELLFARGKIFYQMLLYASATIDFTAVSRIMRDDPKIVAAAKYARAIARVQTGRRDLAEKDFSEVLEMDPTNDPSKLALHWINNRDTVELPPFLIKPVRTKRPMRPPVVRSKVTMTTRPRDWRAERQYDSWILRTLEKKEYGPIQRDVLNRWIEDGRIDFGMKLLRADWSKWQRVERVFKELQPVAEKVEESEVTAFPEMVTKKTTSTPANQ